VVSKRKGVIGQTPAKIDGVHRYRSADDPLFTCTLLATVNDKITLLTVVILLLL